MYSTPPPTTSEGATANPLLSIVVPTIPGRESLLSRCLWSITEQWQPGVQILVVPGPGRLGTKANAAAHYTRAEYMTVVDDDDYLDGAYLSLVLPLLATSPDFVGLKVLQWIDQQFYGVGSTRGDIDRFVHNGQEHGPTPKGVTRTELWRKVPMGNSYKSDRVWCAEVAPLIRSHAFVDRALYIYDHQPATSAFLGGGSRDVGLWPYDATQVEFLTLD